MDYQSSIEWAEENDIEWTHAEAMYELDNHKCNGSENLTDFYSKLGRKDLYKAADVLGWLGY